MRRPACSTRLMVPWVRCMRLITHSVPTGYRSSAPGSSTVASRCVNTTMRLSSVASAASTAATERARPAVTGMTMCGKMTLFLSGNTGRIRDVAWVSVVMVRYSVSCR